MTHGVELGAVVVGKAEGVHVFAAVGEVEGGFSGDELV